MDPATGDTVGFTRRAFIAVCVFVGVILVLLLVWRLAFVFALVFAGGLVALMLDGLAQTLQRALPVPLGLAVTLVVMLLGALGAIVVLLLGPSLIDQFDNLAHQMPAAIENLRQTLSHYWWGQRLLEALPSSEDVVPDVSHLFGRLAGFFSTFLGVLSGAILVVTVGIYGAVGPQQYVSAALRLLPPSRRVRGRQVTDELAHVLRRWLLGRFGAMTAVGVLVWIGMAVARIPLALSLGLIAGALSFVPFIGPVASAVPAILMGFLKGPSGALTAFAVYLAVQLLESNLITPLIEKRAVSLPPAMVIAVQFFMGSLLGIVGILLATPLTVVITTLVQMLYIEDVLGERIDHLGR
jgi:predicted PurR-regulated permease PerM